jgi:hypothetical protein
MAFILLKKILSIWHFKLIGLIGPRAVSERVNGTQTYLEITLFLSSFLMRVCHDLTRI